MQYELGLSMNLEPGPGYVGHSVPLGFLPSPLSPNAGCKLLGFGGGQI